MSEGGDGFFARWSRRKQALREGRQPPPQDSEQPARAQPEAGPRAMAATPAAPAAAPAGERAAAAPAEPPSPPPTLQDVQALTPESDFSRFVRPDVDPQVKNAALRKLFADPHFNVMDGLDVYIDDYHTPNPLPASMLRQMASARFLGLVQDPPEPAAPAAAARAPLSAAASEPAAGGAQPAAAPEPTLPEPMADHDHPDLRLQQDHAAGPAGSERGAR